jgi:nitrogen-specific signal transduction histidine kinase
VLGELPQTGFTSGRRKRRSGDILDKIVHLSEPFVGDEKGNGLGLWVTYQLVLQLDGSIEVKSKNGKTTFDIEFVNKEVA